MNELDDTRRAADLQRVALKDPLPRSSDANKPLVFVCCGLHSSGLTWTFNVAREICRVKAVDFVSCHRESKANLPRDAFGSRLIIVKSHTPMDDLRAFLANSSEPVLITVRDPRDAIASLMQRFGTSFEDAVKTVAVSAERLVALSHQRVIPVFRYEDGFIGHAETFDRVAAMLGTSPSADDREAILDALSKEGVRRTIRDLIATGIIRENEKIHDPKTQWHANHIGDAKVGKFKNILDSAQLCEIAKKTGQFCDRFGYNMTIETSQREICDRDASLVGVISSTPTDVLAREELAAASPPTIPRSRNEVAMQGGIGTPSFSSSAAHQEPAAATEATKQSNVGIKYIGLCMIVKNEAMVIRKCLRSVLPLVDYILVVDTGSTDGTQQIIRDFFAEHGVKGAVIDEPWRDFAYNRSFALERLREVEDIDYALMMDADDIMVLDADFDPRAFKTQMKDDFYDVQIMHGGISHFRAHICSNRQPFSYQGVLHEYLKVPPGEVSWGRATGFSIHANVNANSGRSQNPRKYHDDAAVLERALETETDPFLISRYTFYLAQSYKDCGEGEKALENYLKRAELGHWNEEIYVALIEAGNIMAALNRPFEVVLATYERAYQTVPSRAEALHAAGHYCRILGKNAEGYKFARRGIDLAQPASALFLRKWVYEYGLLDEFAINAYWAGAYRESLDACVKLLASDKLPPSMVKRIATNARYAAEKLPNKAPDLGTLGAESMIDQHRLIPQRALRSRLNGSPRVLIAILAKQKEQALPLYLECIEALDYPKSSIALYIRTNNNTDRTEEILRDWMARVGHLYRSVEFDASDVAEKIEQYREHEWNATRFSVLGHIRNQSMRRARDLDCDYYFVADVDNFIRPSTLRELVALDLPIAAPLLRSIDPRRFYSNYHAEIDPNGYYKGCDQYLWLLERRVRGVVEVPVVHCTYLVRADVISQLTYEDPTGRHEYVVFSESARKAAIPQYLDNRQVYGYVTFGEGDEHYVAGGIDQARALLRDAGDEPLLTTNHSAVFDSEKARTEEAAISAPEREIKGRSVELINAVLPMGEWKRYVLTCFDTLIYYDVDSGEFRHDEVRRSPRNVSVVQSPEGALIRIGAQSASDFESPSSGDIWMQQAISVKNAGFEQNVAFYRDGGLMTAHADGSVTFGARRLRAWEVLRLVPEHHLDSEHYWLPSAGRGGTNLMLERLRGALGEETKRINLTLDSPSPVNADHRPLVVWIHNPPHLSMYQWCRDPEQVARVTRFVFVSQWQRQKFLEIYGLPAERCDVIRNAIETNAATRQWPEHSKWRWRCAYISAPFRGLNILLDAWQELSPINAELHIWSGVSLWGFDDCGYRPLFARAMEMPNVIYHRVAPNATIRAALLDMHFLVYPCTDDECFCLSMVEAMSAGCRVIVPARASLPENAAGFARMYPSIPDQLQHKRALVHVLADELAHPWGGRLDMVEAQQAYCRVTFDWTGRVGEWRRLIESLSP